MLTFNDIKEAALAKWRFVNEGDEFFIVENEEGYRAVIELETSGVNEYVRFRTFTVHKPNEKSGSGRMIHNIGSINATIGNILKSIAYTLERSQIAVESGREQFYQ